MKRNDFKQLASANRTELETKLKESRAKLRALQFDKELGKVKNPHEITMLKKDIARVLTLLTTVV